MRENSVVCVKSRSSQKPSLRQEECSRSSCRLSLRQDCEQRSWGFHEFSLRQGHLAWARWFFAQNSIFRLSGYSSENPWASFCHSRLGETSSLGRK